MTPTKPMKAVAALAVACASVLTAQAQDAGALVEALVKKGILTDQEAEEVRADMTRDFSQTSAGKINLSSSITELKLYGDFRFRYQYDDRQPQVDNGSNVSQRSRYRFRLRLNADIALSDQFTAGFALESGQASDSGNQTYENGFDDYSVWIAKAYLGWKPNDWLNVTLGKFKNPLYTTDLVWDADINPQGAFESIAFHKMDWARRDGEPKWEATLNAGQLVYDDNNEFNFDNDLSTDAFIFVEQLVLTYKFNSDTSATFAPGIMTFTASDLSGFTNENACSEANDITTATAVTQTTVTGRDRVVYSYNAAGALTGATVTRRETTAKQVSQPAVTANGVTNQTRTVNATERVTSSTALNAAQAAARAQSAGVATNIGAGTAGRTTQTDDDNVTVDTTSSTRTVYPAISGESRQLHILTAPGDVSFKLAGLKAKLYWDFAYNVTGEDRFNDIYQLFYPSANQRAQYSTRDGIAWLVGFQLGETKKKGDWQFNLNYRETGIASVDPNLNDSDFALGELNTRGFKLSLAYAVTDAVVFNVTGMMAWNIDKNLFGGRATNSPSIAQDNAVNVLQVDVNVKF